MGIPSYYRWLCKRYPRVPIDAKGDEEVFIDGKPIPTDCSTPNPNEIEFDNLYLDMNGIIHPCCHPESGEAPPTEEEMFLKIHKYIDRIFSIVRPRKVLYMAIDGVAPRAKMNQQRQRRFRAAQERNELTTLDNNLRELFNQTGKSHLLPPQKGPAWDSNVITPGTPFMANLSESLRFYVADRLQNDPGWRNIQVIFSDATVPGEGEHKILHFIRNQRSQPGYNPNTIHCLYGMDADLIMLSLASHEPHFYIVREIVFARSEMVCTTCGRAGHHAGECEGLDKETVIRYADSSLDNYIANADLLRLKSSQSHSLVTIRKRPIQPYQFLSISILREYLVCELDFNSQLFDLERAIDDWVFLCFFVGNDFLPHMPALEIRENALGVMQKIWKSILLSQIRSFEDKLVNNYYNSLSPQEKMRIDKKTLSSSHPDVLAKCPLSFDDKEEICSKLYLTNNGDVNLPNLYSFLQKFQIFEAAILFSKNKKTSDSDRKQRRQADTKASDDANAKQIDQDNKDILASLDVDVVTDNDKNNSNKRKTHTKPPQNDKKNPYDDEGDTKQPMYSESDAEATTNAAQTKKQKTDGTEQNDQFVQLIDIDPAKLTVLNMLLGDCDHKELMKAESRLTGAQTPISEEDSEGLTSDSSTTKSSPFQFSVEGDTTDDSIEVEQPTPIPTTIKTTKSALSSVDEDVADNVTTTTHPKQENNRDKNSFPREQKVEIDLSTGKIVNKVGMDHHTVLPEQNPLKKKRSKGSKIKFGDEYSTINPHIAFQAAMHKLKERLGEAPTGSLFDKKGNVVGKQGEDTIKLGSKGYEERYYRKKFHVDINVDQSAFEHIHMAYITGLRWVFHYYYKGCPSWNWYYPYHYAPLISSLAKIEYSQYLFDVSCPLNPTNTATEVRDSHTIITTSLYSNAQPILPFEQLLSVFPAASSHALPPPLARLMVEPDSPIADFYPAEFGLDTMNKKFMWQGIVQLPFIDMQRLQRTVAKCEHLMTADELERNRHGVNYVFSRFEVNDSNNTNNTALMQVQLESEHKLRDLKKLADNKQQIKLYNRDGSTKMIVISELIEQYNNLKKMEDHLLSQRRTNAKNVDKYYKDVLPQKTILYRTIRQFFNQAVVQKPSAPITLNISPNFDPKSNEVLRQTSPYIQYTHDISQWQYDYSSVLKHAGLTSIMLSTIDRIVEPALAQHTSILAKCIDEKTNLVYLQGYFGLMCGQIQPGQTITPSIAYQTENNDIKPIENAQVVSYIFITPPAGRHYHGLLPGATGYRDQQLQAGSSTPSNKTLNAKDMTEIGIHKQGFGEFTFEYLFSVIKSREVYSKKDSLSKDVTPFDELGLDTFIDKSKPGQSTKQNNLVEDSVFDKIFSGSGPQPQRDGYNSNESSMKHNRGTASYQPQHQQNQQPQQQQQQYQNFNSTQFHQQQQQRFQQNFQNPNMGGYNPMQAPPPQQQMYGGGYTPMQMNQQQMNQQQMNQQQMNQQQMNQQQMIQQQMMMMGGMPPYQQQQQQQMPMQQAYMTHQSQTYNNYPQQQQQQQQQQLQMPFTGGIPAPPQYSGYPQQGQGQNQPPGQQRPYSFQHPNAGRR